MTRIECDFFYIPNNLVRTQSNSERILSAKHKQPVTIDPVEYKHYEPYYCPITLFIGYVDGQEGQDVESDD